MNYKKVAFAVLTIIFMNFSFLKADEYAVPLYDSPLLSGYWQLIGIGSFSKAVNLTDDTNTLQILSDTQDEDEIGTLGIIENNGEDHLSNPSTNKLVELTTLNNVDIDESILYVESTKNIYYSDVEPFIPLYLKIPSIDEAIIRIDFKSSLNGESFKFKTVFEGEESQFYSAVFRTDSARNNPIEAIPEITQVEEVTVSDFNKTKTIESIFDGDLATSTFEPLSGSDELKIYQYRYNEKYARNSWLYYSNQNTGTVTGNDFEEIEPGYGYWMKLNKANDELSKISGIRLDDVGYTLNSYILPSLVEYYSGFLNEGWNLITLPDSTIWNVSSGFIVEVNSTVFSDSNYTTKTIVLTQRDGKEKQLQIDTENNNSVLAIAEELNQQITTVEDLNIRAFPIDKDLDLNLDSILLIGDSSFSLYETELKTQFIEQNSDDNYFYKTYSFENALANSNNFIQFDLNTSSDNKRLEISAGENFFSELKTELESLELNSSNEFNNTNGDSFLDIYLLKNNIIIKHKKDLDLNISIVANKNNSEKNLFLSVKSIYDDAVVYGINNNIQVVDDLDETGVSTLLSNFGYFLKVDENDFTKEISQATIQINDETPFDISTGSGSFDLNIISEKILDNLEDLSLKAILVDTDFDGLISNEDMILLTNNEPFTIAEYTHYRSYKINEDAIELNINTSSQLENKIYIQDIPIVIDTSDTSDKLQALLDSIDLANISNLKVTIENRNDKNYLVLALDPDIGATMTKPLKAYTSTANKNKMLILEPDKTVYKGVFSKLVTVFEMARAKYNSEDKILNIPSGRNPTTNKISIESYSLSNALSILTRSGFAIGKIMTARSDIDTGLIQWDNLDFSISSDKWFDTTENLYIFKTEKEKGYWVHLTDIKPTPPTLIEMLQEWAIFDIAKEPGVDKTDDPYSITLADADTYFEHNVSTLADIPEYAIKEEYIPSDEIELYTPFEISDEVSLNVAFEHYYDIAEKTTENIFSASVTVKLNIETKTLGTENMFAYIMFGNTRVDLVKNSTGDQFTGEIRGYEVGDIRGLSTAEVFVSDGYGNFISKEIELSLVKPEKPTVSIGNYNDKNSVITIDTDDNNSKYFRVYQTFMDDDDETVNQIEYEGNETNISLSNGIPNSYVWGEDQDITLYVVAMNSSSIENSLVSDIVEINYAPLYCGTNKLNSETGITASIPERYTSECVLDEEPNFTDTGVELITIIGNFNESDIIETSIFYRALDDTQFETSPNIPIYMFVSVSGVPVARIKFIDDYLGRVFYFWYNDKVYKGYFGKEFSSQSNLYELSGGSGDEEQGKQVYPPID
jgi:hypothetical protein